MIRDVTGVGGQFVTTWGRDLNGGVWTGPHRTMTYTCTCRCGKTVTGPGFGTCVSVKEHGWQSLKGEAFCSILCMVTHRSAEVRKLADYHGEQSNILEAMLCQLPIEQQP